MDGREDKLGVRDYILVVGHGRSGTNMVLDLFDCHRRTFCRNEPNELPGTTFAGLWDPMFPVPGPAPADFADRWQAAVGHACRANGARDRFSADKDYFRTPLHGRIGQFLMARRKFRALVLPRTEGRVPQEWASPEAYYDLTAHARALPVLKILLTPAWVVQAHDAVPAQRVVHVLRSPRGFVQSWWGRYVNDVGGGPEKVFADNQPSVRRILRHFGRTDSLTASYSLANLVSSELWRWRYMNEVLIAKLSGSPRYLCVEYDDVMRCRVEKARELYAFAGLEMAPTCMHKIEAAQNTIFKARKNDGLDPGLVADCVQDVVVDSPFRAQLLGQEA